MIDINKQYRTRDGREVRLLMTDGGGLTPIIGAIKLINGEWSPCNWPAFGHCRKFTNMDLIEVKPKHVRWVNLYSVGILTREDADSHALGSPHKRIACIRVEFEEGEGLT